jgi:hypothetical protein
MRVGFRRAVVRRGPVLTATLWVGRGEGSQCLRFGGVVVPKMRECVRQLFAVIMGEFDFQRTLSSGCISHNGTAFGDVRTE